jgi:hypothetical protein
MKPRAMCSMSELLANMMFFLCYRINRG